jgi:hypothetical protein
MFLRGLLRFRLRTLWIAVTLFGVYVGGYLALRDPVVAFESKVLVSNGNFWHIRIIPIYRSDARFPTGSMPVDRPKLALEHEPTYRVAAPVSRVVFFPAAWVERCFASLGLSDWGQ